MKILLFLSILFCAIAIPVLGELTDADLNKIRLIVKEEIASEITKTNDKIDAIDVRLRKVETEVSEIKGYQTESQTSLTTTISIIVAIAAVLGFIASQVTQFVKKEPRWETIIKDILTEKQSSSGKETEKETT